MLIYCKFESLMNLKIEKKSDMFTYEFDDDLLLIKYDGPIDINELTAFIEFILLKFDKVIRKTIMDFRTAKINIDLEGIESLTKVRMKFSNSINHLHTVHLVNEVNETVYSTLYSLEIPQHVSKVEVCSTIENTIKLLQLDMTSQQLEAKLKNLASSY